MNELMQTIGHLPASAVGCETIKSL